MFNPPPEVVMMYSLNIRLYVYTSDFYRHYVGRKFKKLPTGYRDGLHELQHRIYDEYGELIPYHTLLMWVDKGLTFPKKAFQLLDDEALIDIVGLGYRLPTYDPTRECVVQIYLDRLINDNDIVNAIRLKTLSIVEQQAYDRLMVQVTGTKYDIKYVDYFIKVYNR